MLISAGPFTPKGQVPIQQETHPPPTRFAASAETLFDSFDGHLVAKKQTCFMYISSFVGSAINKNLHIFKGILQSHSLLASMLVISLLVWNW
jgi:hypothetical protein